MLADPQCGALPAAVPAALLAPADGDAIARLLQRNKVSLLPAALSERGDLHALLALPAAGRLPGRGAADLRPVAPRVRRHSPRLRRRALSQTC